MNDKLKSKEVEQLFKAILSLNDVKECYDFFEDVCTINELLSLAQRFEVVSATESVLSWRATALR